MKVVTPVEYLTVVLERQCLYDVCAVTLVLQYDSSESHHQPKLTEQFFAERKGRSHVSYETRFMLPRPSSGWSVSTNSSASSSLLLSGRILSVPNRVLGTFVFPIGLRHEGISAHSEALADRPVLRKFSTQDIAYRTVVEANCFLVGCSIPNGISNLRTSSLTKSETSGSGGYRSTSTGKYRTVVVLCAALRACTCARVTLTSRAVLSSHCTVFSVVF